MAFSLVEEYSETMDSFEEKFGLVFTDRQLLFGALDHRYNLDTKRNYALAGDALLDFILFDYLIGLEGYSPGMMDSLRQYLNTDDNLADIGRAMGLKPFIVFPNSATENEWDTGSAYYNDTLEALVYGIMKDQGLKKAISFVSEYIISRIPKTKKSYENKETLY